MAEIKSYFLWLQRITDGNAKAPNGGGIPVLRVTASDSRSPGVGSGSGGSGNRLQIDVLEMTATASNLVFGMLTQARDSGANLGTGRIEALLRSGNRRVMLNFDSAIVESVRWLNGFAAGLTQFDVKLSIERPEFVWEPASAGAASGRSQYGDPFWGWQRVRG